MNALKDDGDFYLFGNIIHFLAPEIKLSTLNSWYLRHGIKHKKNFCPFKSFNFLISLILQGNIEKSYSLL
jgi:hypothetical protein